jgi:hypothetical protein
MEEKREKGADLLWEEWGKCLELSNIPLVESEEKFLDPFMRGLI